MGKIVYNSQDVLRTADDIDRFNESNKTDIKNAIADVNRLKNSWSSSVTDRAFTKFKVVENTLEVARYSSMKYQSSYLRQVVNVGYNSTESTNLQNAKNLI